MVKPGQTVRLKSSASEATLERNRQYFVVYVDTINNTVCLDVTGKTGIWYPSSSFEDWYYPKDDAHMTTFKVGDRVVPTFNYWSLKFAEFYVVDAITKVTYSKSRDYGQSRLSILDDRGIRRNYNPRNFKMATLASRKLGISVNMKMPVIGDKVCWSYNETGIFTVWQIAGNKFKVRDASTKYPDWYDAAQLNSPIYHIAIENKDMPIINSAVKTKSRYVIVNASNGQVVASSGEKDPSFNEWTTETLKEWLNEEVSSRLRESPGTKFDVYSFEMQGKLPSISVDWSSK